MKVAELMKILDGVGQGLSEIAKKASDGLAEFHKGMTPFADQNIGDFAAFLANCDEYKRTGVVTGGKRAASARKPANPRVATPKLSVAEASSQFHGILDQITHGTVTGGLIDETIARFGKMTARELEELLKALALQGKPKNKADALAKIKQVLNSQFEMHIRTHPGYGVATDVQPVA